ncbi:MAG TPA: HAD-IA family hydrolase, partial [Opitutales bacterium]|nr:HAD-IA family hydrolase [Opitutales bacterium]
AQVLARHGLDAPQPVLQRRFVQVFREMTKTPRGVVSAESEYAFWRKLVMDVVEPWATGPLAEGVFEDAYRAFADAANWRAPEGADELLAGLVTKGYRLALLSNADARCRKILEDMNLARHFSHVFLSCELGFEKPDLRLFRKVEGILGAAPSEILHVGDSARNDGEGPRAAGWQALVIGKEIASLVEVGKLLP